MSKKLRVRHVITGSIIVIMLLVAIPVGYIAHSWWKDPKPASRSAKPNIATDASQLSATRVDSIVRVANSTEEAIEQLQALVRNASANKKKMSIAGSRHSMGGHTMYHGAIVLDMTSFNSMSYDSLTELLTVGSGAKWSDVIALLDTKGRSVRVMQSNNSFTVGGSVSVNCHGWQAQSPPIASTVESFRLLVASGELITCSRQENPQLFSLALGGYGLFGVLIDIRLRTTANRTYSVQQKVISSDEYLTIYKVSVDGNTQVEMAYGRINVNPGNFMNEAIISLFKVESKAPAGMKRPALTGLRRSVFRGSADNAYGKNLRWNLEKGSARLASAAALTRNSILNEPVEVYQNTDTGYTDILHEYFVPRDSLNTFVTRMRAVVPGFKVDLLNITVREVRRDDDTYLKYAHDDVFGLVLLFNQQKTDKAEAEMQQLTQRLIDEAVAVRGSYYLPYRLHATREQFYRAYPNASDFFALKLKYDPHEVFVNEWYRKYK